MDVETEQIVATAAETLAATLLAGTQVLPPEVPEAAEDADVVIESSESETLSTITEEEPEEAEAEEADSDAADPDASTR